MIVAKVNEHAKPPFIYIENEYSDSGYVHLLWMTTPEQLEELARELREAIKAQEKKPA